MRGTPRRAGRTPAARARSTVTVIFALIWLLAVAGPLYYMFIVSFEPVASYLDSNPWLPTRGLTLSNYTDVLANGFWTNLFNSLVVGLGSTLFAVVLSLFAAYAIVRHTSRLTGFMFRFFLVGFAVPIQALMIPLYIEVQRLHLYDTLLGMLLPITAFALPTSVFVLANFVREVPAELMEAMEVDGGGPVRILWSLVRPLSMPAIATVGIFNLIMSWNNFLFPLLLTQSPERATLPLAVFNFEGRNFANIPTIMASLFLATAPLLLLYLVARRRIAAALTQGFGK
jgi:raffinose/stachyose/melibiose transport system permease protein